MYHKEMSPSRVGHINVDNVRHCLQYEAFVCQLEIPVLYVLQVV